VKKYKFVDVVFPDHQFADILQGTVGNRLDETRLELAQHPSDWIGF
jgi:hypothetical protein